MTIATAVSKTARHLQQGSFVATLVSHLRNNAKKRRIRWWDTQKKKGATCLNAYRISGARTNLYFESQLCKGVYVVGFEESELAFVTCFLKAGDVFLDIGANIGIYSLVAAKCVGPTGMVHSFEPHQKTYEWLQQNIRQHGNGAIASYNLAISDAICEASLNVSLEGFDAWNSLSQPTRGSAFRVEKVAAMGLDDFCRQKAMTADAITMVKIDVEGWESRVLVGAERCLSHPNAPTLQIEFSVEALRNNGSSVSALADQVSRLGYGLYNYDPAHKMLVRIRNWQDCANKNVLAVKHPERVAARSDAALVS